MDPKTITKSLLTVIFSIFGVFLLIYLLFTLKIILIYIACASILTLIGKPITLFLHSRLRFNRNIATIITMGVFIGFIFSLISLFVPLFINQGQSLSFLNYDYLEQNIIRLTDIVFTFIESKGYNIKDVYSPKEILSHIDFKVIPTFFNSLLTLFTELSIGVFAILFITFYLINEKNVLKRVLLGVSSEKHHTTILNVTTSIKTFLSRYFIGLFVQITLLFIIYAITLLIFDIPNALVIAFLCALFNLIPYVGPLIGVVLMLTFSLIGIINEDFNDVILPTGLYITIIYIFAQLFDNFISQPIIFSKSAKSHPLEIFIIILIFGIVFGIVGMMIAVPCYTSIKVIVKEFFPTNKIVQFFTKNL